MTDPGAMSWPEAFALAVLCVCFFGFSAAILWRLLSDD